MLVQCKHCGAPLDVAANVTHAKCTYCDTTNKVRSMQTIAPSTPVGWAPPPQWQPPPQYHLPPRPMPYHAVPPVRRSAAPAMIVAIAMLLLIAGGAAVPILMRSGSVGGISLGQSWDGSSPFRCGGNDSVRIEDVTANLQSYTAITVEANCELEIVRSNIVANEGIYAGGNRRVTIRDSTIATRSTGIVAGGNKQVVLVNSNVTSGGIAIDASGNAQVTATGGTVTGFPTAYRQSANAQVNLSGAQFVGSGQPLPF